MVDVGASGMGSVSAMTDSVGEATICKNLTVLSSEAEMREEENVRKATYFACPTKVPTRQGSESAMSKTYTTRPAALATNLQSGRNNSN